MAKSEKQVIELNKNLGDSEQKIEAIKNLIFGDNIQAYNEEFEQLKKDILDKKKALEELIEEVSNELHKSVDGLSTDINIRVTELEENLDNKLQDLDDQKINKKMLGKLLVELGEKISNK